MTSNKNRLELFRFFSGKKVLVTGASGYIANNLILKLTDSGCRIVRLSRKFLLPADSEIGTADIRADVSTEDGWESWIDQVDVIFHLAGQTSAYAAEASPLDDWKVNVLPVLNMCKACKNKGTKPIVVFASTATVIGLSDKIPVGESRYEAPITVYDIHKLMSEKYLAHYTLSGSIRSCSLRLANVYGPGSDSGSSDRGIVNQMMRLALQGRPLTVYGEGNAIRDFVYIDDVTEAFMSAAACSENTAGHSYFIGSGRGCTIKASITEIAVAAEKITGKPVAVVHTDPPANLLPIEHRNFIADISAFSVATGWNPRYDFRDGLAETASFFSSQQKRTR
jgi:nucleoside-diphosphate-sugar epimerase